ncbi:cytochrome P450 [Rhodococcus cerastii]|nr:cytochrome P450 [Rhodococcus cerastii]
MSPTPPRAPTDTPHTAEITRFPFPRPVPTEPSPVLGQLRGRCPVAEIELPSGDPAWVVTRYQDVKDLLADPRFSCAAAAHPDAPHFVPFVQLSRSLLSIDGAEHSAARRLLARGLNPGFITRFTPTLERIVDRCLDTMAASGPPIDFLTAVNIPFAEAVMAELLGVSTEVVVELRRHLDAAISISEVTDTEITRLWSELSTLVQAQLADKRAHPGDDLLSTITRTDHPGPTMTETEVIGIVLSILTPGVVTPIVQITNGLATLLHHRQQYLALVQDRTLVPAAVEEILRFNAPVEVDHLRMTTTEVTLAGTTLPAHSAVFPSITAANRDERRFEAPDEFDIHRRPNPHIAFGHGPHACPASSLARVFLTIFFDALVHRFPDLALAGDWDDLTRRAPGLHSVDVEELLLTWGPDDTDPRHGITT